MRNVFVRTDFRVLHRRAESVGRSDRPASRGFRLLVVVQQREQRGLTLRQASLSIRDIGSALGLSWGTVQRELDAADPASLPNTIVVADGKERSASKSTVSVDDSDLLSKMRQETRKHLSQLMIQRKSKPIGYGWPRSSPVTEDEDRTC